MTYSNKVLQNQIDLIHNNNPEDLEYLLWHYSPTFSYYNIYPTRKAAFWEGIKPRYWSGETVILVRVKDKPKKVLDLDSIT